MIDKAMLDPSSSAKFFFDLVGILLPPPRASWYDLAIFGEMDYRKLRRAKNDTTGITHINISLLLARPMQPQIVGAADKNDRILNLI